MSLALVVLMALLASLIMSQEAMVQYEQYEQEVKNLQRLIEEAHRVIQDRPVATGNIQELQTQIQHHEVRKSIRLSCIYTLAHVD